MKKILHSSFHTLRLAYWFLVSPREFSLYTGRHSSREVVMWYWMKYYNLRCSRDDESKIQLQQNNFMIMTSSRFFTNVFSLRQSWYILIFFLLPFWICDRIWENPWPVPIKPEERLLADISKWLLQNLMATSLFR